MSDIGEKFKGTELDSDILRISLGASRWQERDKTDWLDVMNAYNAYQTALKNPTKNPDESLVVLYDKIGEANSLILDGSDPDVLGKAEYVVKGIQKKLPTLFDPQMIVGQLDKLKDKDLGNSALALIFSNDMKKTFVLEIPI